ncbi:MAG: N-acetylneuraminate synthase [Candidatus Firestonebacteria bacterium]
MSRVFIIAEAGVNHNGSLRIAKKLVDVASASGADAVKFQTFTAESLVIRTAPKASYQISRTDGKESKFEMIKKLELSKKDHLALMQYCRSKKIHFLSSPFDIKSAELLLRMGLKIFKIPSGEITNLPYLRTIGAFRKRVILSTGMSTLREINQALDMLIRAGTRKRNITVLHCTTAYPVPFEDVNLRAIPFLSEKLNVSVGYSDHTIGIEAAIAAAALGARVIEKHFTLDRSMEGPDHSASLKPDELKTMVTAIRHIEKALGDKKKKVSASEAKNLPVVRKSIVASRAIVKGEKFSNDNITTKRPAGGITPMHWDLVIGKTAKRDFKKDESIEL